MLDDLLKGNIQTRPFRMYNPDEPNHPTKIFGGKASNIRNWDDIKYPIFHEYQERLFGEFWIPQEVSMVKDRDQYKNLTKDEQRVYKYNSGMLNWLDSMASDVVTMLFMSTTDPSLRSLLTLIASFETMHNVSYEFMTASVLNNAEKEQAFQEVREIKELQVRNDHIITKLDNMTVTLSNYLVRCALEDKQSEMTEDELQVIFEGIVAYQILEGLYFSGGFVYFHSLARDNKMIESNNIINLIKADENQHSEIFGTLIQILMQENPHLNTQENLDNTMEYIKKAVDLEKEFTALLYEDIDILPVSEYHDYAEYLSNLICRNAGLPEPYPNNAELKSSWIVTYGSKKSNGVEIAPKADFLQGNAINYRHEDGGDFDL